MSSASSQGAKSAGFLPSRKSLSWRIAAWSAGGSILIVLAVGIAMYLAMVAQVRSIDEQVLLKRALRVRDVLQTEESVRDWLGHEVSEDLEGPRQVFMRVLRVDGALMAETPGMADVAPAAIFPEPADAPERARIATLRMAEGRAFRVFSVRVGAAGVSFGREAIIQTAVDTSLDELLLARFRTTLLFLLAPAIVGCILVAVAIASRLLSPLRLMAKEAECIGAREKGQRLTATSAASELLDLTTAFNGVLQRLEHARDSLRGYADNVAHEIRTPLNRMLLNAEIAVREPRSQAEYQDIMEAQVQECSALSHLTQRLLFLARAESGRLALTREALPLRHELEVLRNYFEAAATEANINMTVDVEPTGLQVFAERELLQQAIGNLVTNALAHTPAGGAIHLRARRERDGAAILISDTGEGIAEHHLPYVFDRFYRASEGDGDAGEKRVGLGLAISKSIVDVHGGEVSIVSGVGEGTTVRTWWPEAERI